MRVILRDLLERDLGDACEHDLLALAGLLPPPPRLRLDVLREDLLAEGVTQALHELLAEILQELVDREK